MGNTVVELKKELSTLSDNEKPRFFAERIPYRDFYRFAFYYEHSPKLEYQIIHYYYLNALESHVFNIQYINHLLLEFMLQFSVHADKICPHDSHIIQYTGSLLRPEVERLAQICPLLQYISFPNTPRTNYLNLTKFPSALNWSIFRIPMNIHTLDIPRCYFPQDLSYLPNLHCFRMHRYSTHTITRTHLQQQPEQLQFTISNQDCPEKSVVTWPTVPPTYYRQFPLTTLKVLQLWIAPFNKYPELNFMILRQLQELILYDQQTITVDQPKWTKSRQEQQRLFFPLALRKLKLQLARTFHQDISYLVHLQDLEITSDFLSDWIKTKFPSALKCLTLSFQTFNVDILDLSYLQTLTTLLLKDNKNQFLTVEDSNEYAYFHFSTTHIYFPETITTLLVQLSTFNQDLSELYQLKQLDMSETEYFDWSHVQFPPSLKILDIQQSNVPFDFIQTQICHLPELEELNLLYILDNFTSMQWSQLRLPVSLKILLIHEGNVGLEHQSFDYLPNLEFID